MSWVTAAGGQRGSMTLELGLLAPGLLLLIMLVGWGGRLGAAQLQVNHAAAVAARGASLRGSPTTAAVDARRIATENLVAAGVTCAPLDVSVRGSLTPGGQVRVDVSCRADLGEMAFLGLPAARRISASSVEPVDTFRGGGP